MGRLGGSAVDPLRASPNRLIQVLVFSFERGRRLLKTAPATHSLSRVANGCRTSIAQPIPPTTPASRCARAGQAPPHRAALLGLSQDRQAPRKEAGPRAGAGRWDGGTEARRPAVDQVRSPPRGPRGGAGDRAWRDSTTWWDRPAPSDECDGLVRSGPHSPGSGSRGRGGGAPGVALGESSGFAHRPPRLGRPGRVASPPGWRRTPGAGTFQLERVRRPRGPTWTTTW